MIDFHYEFDFQLDNPLMHADWLRVSTGSAGYSIELLNYIFCSDEYLLEINRKFLGHDYYTDIVTFAEEGDGLKGDIFISVERVRENANAYNTNPDEEMRRVMIHGVLHLMGWEDETEFQKGSMREKEEALMKLFHVKQS